MAISKAMVELPRKPHALYRFFDRTDALLYVGITMDLPARVGSHQKDKPWWVEVHHITVEQFDTRSSALAAEEAAIKQEGPLYNSAHNELVSNGAELIRTSVGPKRQYADHILHQLADGQEQYDEWLAQAREDITTADPDDDLASADEVVYATELAASELSIGIFTAHTALERLLSQLPQDQVDRCRDRASERKVALDAVWTESELLEQAAWFIGAEFAAEYLDELRQDERNEWISAARVFMKRTDASWWQVATEAASYARHRKASKWYAPAASMCNERGQFSLACTSKAQVRVWFEDCRICRRWQECQLIMNALRAIVDGATAHDGAERPLTDEEAERHEALEVKLGVLRTRDCVGHIMWCREHLQQAIERPFTWIVDGLPMVVSKQEVLEPDWDDPWRSANPPF